MTEDKKNSRDVGPSDSAPARRKKPANPAGAPRRNRNRTRHGLSAGQLPRGCSYVAALTIQLRKALEAAVIEAKGELSLIDIATVQTCIRWERHALLAQRWLRKSAADMTHDQRLSYSREIARASAERDRSLRSLGIARTDDDLLLTATYVASDDDSTAEAENASLTPDSGHPSTEAEQAEKTPQPPAAAATDDIT